MKDLVTVEGARETPLVGYGLVVGLDGTGDGRNSMVTVRSVRNMLLRFNIEVPQERLVARNVAAVMVTASLPAFVRAGARLDVTVSSLGDARSLEGGTLLLTPLTDHEGTVYGVAQGPVSVGGFNVETIGGERYRKNYSVVGRVPRGLLVERSAPSSLPQQGKLALSLKEPDFTSAMRVASAVDSALGLKVAKPLDASTIEVEIPEEFQGSDGIVRLLATIEGLEVNPDQVARVVINERTGTVVVGKEVRLEEAAVSHGNLTIQVRAIPVISQPAAFSQGRTVVVPQTMTTVTENAKGSVMLMEGTATVSDLAQALNALKVTPRDMISIFQALKQAGALRAELVIM
ncbi:MAG: flagellar basal body P-ring protein FlgI [candidate division KSB1 bacterium]|nr:flagellar basal body P-ring protein FlgI [candidate division KSB1 bacterium]MDZ7385298.1 flagellar basal body P-ring protein FlgI [candidate division KSB1 bacterium]MDZ7393402.1 flagellar basal body P-ring protein FlgI [candidate division KSB1 bacterium]MDZ7413832.1 flagellar basal body P-ring protein FlgI [candidate division KSB1 bacterium]